MEGATTPTTKCSRCTNDEEWYLQHTEHNMKEACPVCGTKRTTKSLEEDGRREALAVIEIIEREQEEQEERGRQISAKLQEQEIKRARGEVGGTEGWIDMQTMQRLLTIYCELCAELKEDWVMCKGCKHPTCRTCAHRCQMSCPFCKTGKFEE